MAGQNRGLYALRHMSGRVYAGKPLQHYDAPIHNEYVDAPIHHVGESIELSPEGKVSTVSENRAAGLEKNIESAIKAVKKIQEDLKALGNITELSRRKANLSLELLAAEVQQAQETFTNARQ